MFAVLFALLMLLSAGASMPALAFDAPTCSSSESAKPGMTGCGKNCAECHKLSIEEASKILDSKANQATVTDVRPSPIKGLWQITVTQGGNRFAVYVDFAKEYLIQLQGAPMALKRRTVDVGKIPADDAVVIGSKRAEKKIIVFSDPDCPFCRKLHTEMKKAVEKRKDVAFYVMLYPLPMHPGAYKKALAVQCEKTMKLLDAAFEGAEMKEPTCSDTKTIDNNIALAKSLSIDGTPALIFPNGEVLPGYVEADRILNVLDNPQK